MSKGRGDEQMPEPMMLARFGGHALPPELSVFEKVSDRDLVTLADVLCRSLEFHSMLVASKVMREVGVRELWSTVIERRSQSLRRSDPDLGVDSAHLIAEREIERFRDEHFPVEPEVFDSDPQEAERRWNGYIQF